MHLFTFLSKVMVNHRWYTIIFIFSPMQHSFRVSDDVLFSSMAVDLICWSIVRFSILKQLYEYSLDVQAVQRCPSIWQEICSIALFAKIGIKCSFMKVFYISDKIFNILHKWAHEQLNCSFAQIRLKMANLSVVCHWGHSIIIFNFEYWWFDVLYRWESNE